MTSITALNGVQWTEINGSEVEAERTDALDYIESVDSLTTLANSTVNAQTRLPGSVDSTNVAYLTDTLLLNASSYSYFEFASGDRVYTLIDRRFAMYDSLADAQAARRNGVTGRITYWNTTNYDGAQEGVSGHVGILDNYGSTNLINSGFTRENPPGQSVRNTILQQFGDIFTAANFKETIYPVYGSYDKAKEALGASSSMQVATTYYNEETNSIWWLVKNFAGVYWGQEVTPQANRAYFTGLGYSYLKDVTDKDNSFINIVAMRWGVSDTEDLTVSEWKALIKKNAHFSYLDASKLKISEGGGIKTYDGKWYVNGEQVSYLEVFFAVNINKLYVINERINTALDDMNKNNKKIKIANEISSALAAISPTTTDGTKSRWDMLVALKPVFAKYPAELFDALPVATGEYHADTILNGLGNSSAALVQTGDGTGYAWRLKNAGGTIYWDKTFATGGEALAYWLTTLTTNGFSYSKVSVNANFWGFLNYFPSSGKKVFAEAWAIGDTGTTFRQTDFSTMTTEIRNNISTIESDNTTLQTLLDQYNNKRTNTLDAISNIVKGNNQSMSTLARNSGAFA